MTDADANLVLEQLRATRNEVAAFRTEARERHEEVILRLGNLERDFASMKVDLAGMQVRLRFESRLSRIERRLDLVDGGSPIT
jgi:hypothetical protein